jgi:hypothetical protein
VNRRASPRRRRRLSCAGLLALVSALAATLAFSAVPTPGRKALVYMAAARAAGRQQLLLERNGDRVELVDATTHHLLGSRPLTDTSAVIVRAGKGSDDTPTVDLSGGPLELPDGVSYDGGRGGYDTLKLVGGRSRAVGYQFSGAGAGQVGRCAQRPLPEPGAGHGHDQRADVHGQR